jgi:hypothetical protein
VGLSLNNTRAVIEAVWTGRKYKKGDKNVRNEFIRTPKYATSGRVRAKFITDNLRDTIERKDQIPSISGSVTTPARKSNIWTLSKLMLPIIEVAFGIYMSCHIFISLKYNYAEGAVPFMLIFAVGYFYVGFSSLSVLWKMHQEAEAAIEAEANLEAADLLPQEVVESPVRL